MYKRLFSMFRRIPKNMTSLAFCINFLTLVGSKCFDRRAKAPPSVLFKAAIWLSFVTLCPLCPPVQFGKKMYALSWQRLKLQIACIVCVSI